MTAPSYHWSNNPPWLYSWNISKEHRRDRPYFNMNIMTLTNIACLRAEIVYHGRDVKYWCREVPWNQMVSEIGQFSLDIPEFRPIVMWWVLLKLGVQPMTFEMLKHYRATMAAVDDRLAYRWMDDYERMIGRTPGETTQVEDK